MRAESHPTKRGVIAVAAALSALLACSSAQAFCRTTTERPPPEFQPLGDEPPCWGQGLPLYHPSQCFPYRLLAKESSVIPNAVLSDKLARAFGAWTAPNPKCTPGISAIELAPASDTVIVGYRSGERGNNLIGVPTTFNGIANETLSLATLTFNPASGEVYDVDLEINGGVSWSFSETPPPEGFDLESILTHEVGHMLGFAHSPEVDSTMFASYSPGSIEQRTLNDDDRAAVCAVFPNRGQRLTGSGLTSSTTCNLAPGPNQGCADANVLHGCATAPGDNSAPVGLAFGVVVALGAIAVRRRRLTPRARL